MRVLVATGSSGGHVFPAVSLMDALARKDPKGALCLLMPRRSAVPVKGFPVIRTSIDNIPRKLSVKTLRAAGNLVRGSWESVLALLRFKPDVVVGFGSIDSFPVLFLSWLFRIRTLIHEQNVIPGKANQVLAKLVDRIAISFEDSKLHFRGSEDKTVFTGNLIRQGLTRIDRKSALGHFGFSDDKVTLLVMGGSQGSHHINDAFLEALGSIPARSRIQVIHLAGEKEAGLLEDRYRQLNVSSRVYGFFQEMQYAYSAADFAVSRAGATTVTELIHFSIPAVLVPYPYAHRHQLYNARVLERQGCASIIIDADLGSGALLKCLESLLQDPEMISGMRAAYKGLSVPDAAGSLAKEVLSLGS